MKVPRVAVVGGGISGTLASLVLKNRNISPLIIDMGKGGVGGRLRSSRSKLSPNVDAGAQFFRASDPRLATVFGMLERNGMLSEWKGRFGMLGSRGGGFLPSSIVGSSMIGGMGSVNPEGGTVSTLNNVGSEESQDDSFKTQPTDAGDFCGFVQSHRPDSVTTYVGSPTNTDLCPQICSLAEIDVLTGTKVTKAIADSEGGWKLQMTSGDNETEELFDALILTQDMPLTSSTVRAIAEGESRASEADAAAGGSNEIHERLNNLANDLKLIGDHGKMPLFTWSGRFDSSFSAVVPFDAASVPGSNFIQFVARESSKPGRSPEGDEGAIWTAVSTSAFAAGLLEKHGLTWEASEEANKYMSDEMAHVLSAAISVDSGSKDVQAPFDSSAIRWGAALTSKTLGLKEESVALAPWRLAICGDFVREIGGHETPFESAALSGLEAGERVASLFAQDQYRETN